MITVLNLAILVVLHTKCALTNPYDPNFKIRDNRFNMIWIWMMDKISVRINAKEHENILYNVLCISIFILRNYLRSIRTHRHPIARWDDTCHYEVASDIPANKPHKPGLKNSLIAVPVLSLGLPSTSSRLNLGCTRTQRSPFTCKNILSYDKKTTLRGQWPMHQTNASNKQAKKTKINKK